MMTTTMHIATADDGTNYIYSTGLIEFGRPELIMLTESGVLPTTDCLLALFSAVIQRQIAAANGGIPVPAEETILVRDLGVQLRLSTGRLPTHYSMVRVGERYGCTSEIVTLIEIESRQDA